MTQEEINEAVADLVGNAKMNEGPNYFDTMTRKEIAGDMIAYADDAFNVEDSTDLEALEENIVLALKELNVGIDASE